MFPSDAKWASKTEHKVQPLIPKSNAGDLLPTCPVLVQLQPFSMKSVLYQCPVAHFVSCLETSHSLISLISSLNHSNLFAMWVWCKCILLSFVLSCISCNVSIFGCQKKPVLMMILIIHDVLFVSFCSEWLADLIVFLRFNWKLKLDYFSVRYRIFLVCIY